MSSKIYMGDNDDPNIKVSTGSVSVNSGRIIRTYSGKRNKNILVEQDKQTSVTKHIDREDYEHQIAKLQQQLQSKNEIIRDLKLCLASNENTIKQMQKRHNIAPEISAEQRNAEIRKLLPMLTSNQLALMLKEKKRVNWTSNEIATGFAHSYLGKRGYNFTIHKLGIPEPSIRTLQRWGENMNIVPGILEDCLTILKATGECFSEEQRQVILCYDEMKCKSLYEYNKTLDIVMGPNDQMQTIMVRGLFSKFKQPVFVDFDVKVSCDILMELISKLYDTGFNVVGCVSDNGGGNQGLWTNYGVNYEKTTILHPVTGSEICMFSDIPHLLKLLRNWFIDGGFLLKDGTELNQAKIRELLKMNTEISPLFKISLKHLIVEKTERQNVRLASELFSRTVSHSLLRNFATDSAAKKLAHFIELVNDWFDIMNSYSITGIGYKQPYGVDLDEQNKVLDEMYNTVKTMKCFNKKHELQNALQVFQKGIMMSITSVKFLLNQMDQKFDYKYLLTHRLNQDCLENFFSQMRYRNGANDHPSPVECLYNMKSIILGKNPGVVASMHTNTIDRNPEQFASATFHKSLSEANSSIARSNTNEKFPIEQLLEPLGYNSNDSPDEFMEKTLPESFDYNSDDGPEEFVEEDLPESLDYISDDEPENSYEHDYERVVELRIEHDTYNEFEIFEQTVNDYEPVHSVAKFKICGT